jgi:protocatechuate 3,4-dioxygenase beta subunit
MEQSRKIFLKKFLIGAGSVPLIVESCKKSDLANGSSTGTDSGSGSGSCTVTDTETDGPYPLYNSRGSAIQRVSIADGKTGVPLNISITIKNVNNSCAVLANAIVDIWHCDKDGYYSGYSNSGYLGTQNNSSLVFCRGRQITDSNGLVKFESIYPGWYSGRCIHIHVQIYVGSSLKLTTQIAFPDTINAAVCATSLYAAHGQPDTTNTKDGIISNSLTNELASVVANSSGGYDLTHTIYIAA